MSVLFNVAGEAIQWLVCLFVVALYLDYRRLRRRLEHLEEASRWRDIIEGGHDPRNYQGWHDFTHRALMTEAGEDVAHLWGDKSGGMLRPFPSEPSRRRA